MSFSFKKALIFTILLSTGQSRPFSFSEAMRQLVDRKECALRVICKAMGSDLKLWRGSYIERRQFKQDTVYSQLLICFGLLGIRFGVINKIMNKVVTRSINRLKKNPKMFADNAYTMDGVRELSKINIFYSRIHAMLNFCTSTAYTLWFYKLLDIGYLLGDGFEVIANIFQGYFGFGLFAHDGYYLLNDTFGVPLAESLEKWKQLQNMQNLTEGVQVIDPATIAVSTDDLVLPAAIKDFTNDVLEPYFKEKKNFSKGCGALFYGPPGTGKTTFALACAKKLGLKVVFVTAAAMIGGGAGPAMSSSSLVVKKIEALFELAYVTGPCIIVFDEIEVLTKQRDFDSVDSTATIGTNALLTALDKCFNYPHEKRVFVIGTTNSDIANHDEAIRRSGRLGFSLAFDNQGLTGKKNLVEFFLKKHVENISPEQITQMAEFIVPCVENSSPAELEAVLKAIAGKGRSCVLSQENVLEIVLEVKNGKIDTQLKQDLGQELRHRHAISNAGSIVAGLLNIKDSAKAFKYASIEPRISGQEVQVQFSSPSFAKSTKQNYENMLAMLIGGELAEEILIPGEGHSALVEKNYQNAYKILETMCRMGMLQGVSSKSSEKKRSNAMDQKLEAVKQKVSSQLQRPEVQAAVKAVTKLLEERGTVSTHHVLALPEVIALVAS